MTPHPAPRSTLPTLRNGPASGEAKPRSPRGGDAAPGSRADVCWVVLGVVLAVDPAAAAPVDAPRAWTLAYIDPGTGSFLVQAVVAAVAGIAVTSRMYWEKIRVFFGAAPRDPERLEDDTDDE